MKRKPNFIRTYMYNVTRFEYKLIKNLIIFVDQFSTAELEVYFAC